MSKSSSCESFCANDHIPLDRTNLELLRHYRPNVLLMGTESATASALQEIVSVCREPIREYPIDRHRPEPQFGTAIVHNVADLNTSAQQALYDWMSRHGARLQIISVTNRPILPLVESGAFLAALFYRLNVVTLVATPRIH
jgi:sigma-54-interacting transcriptional regulator